MPYKKVQKKRASYAGSRSDKQREFSEARSLGAGEISWTPKIIQRIVNRIYRIK